ncbi:hypothetical protein JZ751_006509 [Albula glossodonta]|uniref:Uncharacterized protein n=1 Tax=Albula glossodonta TaxID=121402 RepID=A0A8T2N7Z7_9TELE|nr:hypothetical protein JZ751_006509 [Albula glossodonta]
MSRLSIKAALIRPAQSGISIRCQRDNVRVKHVLAPASCPAWLCGYKYTPSLSQQRCDAGPNVEEASCDTFHCCPFALCNLKLAAISVRMALFSALSAPRGMSSISGQAKRVELSCPKEMAWKVNMHRGYLAICHPEEQQLNFIERLVEMASSLAIREWRRLPHIVSHVHTPLLQGKPLLISIVNGGARQRYARAAHVSSGTKMATGELVSIEQAALEQ